MDIPHDRAVREAARPFSSFSCAVVAHLRVAFGRGATETKISYVGTGEGGIALIIEDNGRSLSLEQLYAITKPSPNPRDAYETLALTPVHHARRLVAGGVSTTGASVQFWDLGSGAGVNPRQDRSAAKLAMRLPAMLTVREAGMVTVVGADGRSTRIGSADCVPEETGDHRVWAPRLRATLDGRRPLLLQYGAVRVPIATVISRIGAGCQYRYAERRALEALASPWFAGIIEITRKDGSAEFPIPLDDFPDESYAGPLVRRLVTSLIATGVDKTMRGEIDAVADRLWRTVARDDRSFVFRGAKYDVHVGEGPEDDEVIWRCRVDRIGEKRIGFDPLSPVFQIDSRSEAIVERMVWTIANFLSGGGDAASSYVCLRSALAESRQS